MTWLYTRLLRCYPRAFRARFGDELTGAFAAGLAASRARGVFATLVFLVTRFADVVISGLAERRAAGSSALPGVEASPAGARWWLQDVRIALRQVRRQPGTSLVIVATLALGIGASTAVFSVLDIVLLRTLPYPDADRLVLVETTNAPMKIVGGPASYPDFLDWRSAGIFEDAGIYLMGNAVIRLGDATDRVRAGYASASLFTTLGVRPILGRLPTAQEDRPSRQPVVLLTEATWRRRFAGDPAILARPVHIDGKPLSIVGVLPASFAFGGEPELWTTFEDDGDVTTRENRYLNVIARLRPGAALTQVEAQLDARCAELDRTYGESNRNWRATVQPWQASEVRDARPQLVLLAASVALVLVIGCSNVAMLLLVRGTARAKELAVRAALGAGRWRIVSQLLTESLVLALVAGTFGVGLAAWWVSLFARFGPRDIPRLAETTIDGRVLLFALATSCLAVVLFGLAPALQVSRPNVTSVLQDASRSATPGRRRRVVGYTLLIGETAISLVLIVGAALLVKSFVRLADVDAGFRVDHLLTFHLPLPSTKFLADGKYQADRVRQYFEDVLARLEARPEVIAAAATMDLPVGGGGYRTWQSVEVEGHPETGQGKTESVSNSVTPHYFAAMGMPLRAGRGLTERDTATAAPVVVVSDTFARRFLAGENPIGRHVRMEGDRRLAEIVGVVGDLKPDGLDSAANPIVYKPFAQSPKPFMAIVVHTRNEPAAFASTLGAELRQIDADVPPYRVRSAEELVARSLGARRFGTVLMAVFAGVALVLALVGLYAVLTHVVAQGAREIGLRIALGAGRGGVLHAVLRQALAPATIGLAVGVGLALLVAPAMRGLLYGVEPLDPLVILLVPCAFAMAALVACLVPARRALRVDPIVALRAE